jgi:hypothetical protein
MPRMLKYAIKADIMRRRSTTGRVSAPSDADIDQMFRDVGVEPVWYLDTPAWATPTPSMKVAGKLGNFTRNVEILLAPRGKFAMMDRGELSIGVQGNHLYRDTAQLMRNEFTMFWENFEGLVDTDSCPAGLLRLNNLCFNGQQIADIVINCEGGDEVGPAS